MDGASAGSKKRKTTDHKTHTSKKKVIISSDDDQYLKVWAEDSEGKMTRERMTNPKYLMPKKKDGKGVRTYWKVIEKYVPAGRLDQMIAIDHGNYSNEAAANAYALNLADQLIEMFSEKLLTPFGKTVSKKADRSLWVALCWSGNDDMRVQGDWTMILVNEELFMDNFMEIGGAGSATQTGFEDREEYDSDNEDGDDEEYEAEDGQNENER